MYVWIYRFFKEIDESGQVIKDQITVYRDYKTARKEYENRKRLIEKEVKGKELLCHYEGKNYFMVKVDEDAGMSYMVTTFKQKVVEAKE